LSLTYAGEMSLAYHQGQTVLLAPVAEAEPVVGRWRGEFDETASEGIPPHISILFPFVARDELSKQVLEAVAELIGQHRAIDSTLADVRRFPDGNVYLWPDPEAPFRRLTEAIWRRWPDPPPYGGRFEEIIPHLTVAIAPPAGRVAEIETSLLEAIPGPRARQHDRAVRLRSRPMADGRRLQPAGVDRAAPLLWDDERQPLLTERECRPHPTHRIAPHDSPR
jgi:2'-5' RNA ligase